MAKQVNIINVDSKIPNLALAKVEKFYRDKGYSIESLPLYAGQMPTYVSVVFDWNRNQVLQFEGLKDTLIGGTGYDVSAKLPPEIESIKPRLNFGYTTRGC